MALAQHFENLIEGGHITDYADLARLGGVTRARMTQIMSLLNLAPDIIEDILYLPRTVHNRDAVSTKALLPIAQILEWKDQREAWRRVRGGEAENRPASAKLCPCAPRPRLPRTHPQPPALPTERRSDLGERTCSRLRGRRILRGRGYVSI